MRTQNYVIFKSSSIYGILGHLIKKAFEFLNRNKGFPGGPVVKNPPAVQMDTRDMGSISESGRSPGGGHGNPLQYSCLENPMDRGAWQATVHSIGESWTQLKQLSTNRNKVAKYDFVSITLGVTSTKREQEVVDG